LDSATKQISVGGNALTATLIKSVCWRASSKLLVVEKSQKTAIVLKMISGGLLRILPRVGVIANAQAAAGRPYP
jgi:hypothetical protein